MTTAITSSSSSSQQQQQASLSPPQLAALRLSLQPLQLPMPPSLPCRRRGHPCLLHRQARDLPYPPTHPCYPSTARRRRQQQQPQQPLQPPAKGLAAWLKTAPLRAMLQRWPTMDPPLCMLGMLLTTQLP